MSNGNMLRPATVIQLVLMVIICFAISPACGQDNAAANGNSKQPTEFTTDPAARLDRFGVFIGIDHYPNVRPNQDLDGCVNDATRMAALFTGPRFGIQRYVLLTDHEATRAGISKVFHSLIEQVRAARSKTDQPITVVITYSGHGSRVARMNATDALGPNDSTWVAADSDSNGSADVRGEELNVLHKTLKDLGVQVLMMSDSCHSATAYRGLDRHYRVRGISRDKSPAGPQEGMFADLKPIDVPYQAAPGKPIPGFVWFAACADSKEAFEDEYPDGKGGGRLSIALNSILSTEAETTNAALFRRISERFAVDPNWSDQQPEMHAGAGLATELFFAGGASPPHGEVVKTNPDGTVEVSMGQIHGIQENTAFLFYESAADASARQRSLGQGVAIRVGPVSCSVKVQGHIPATAWAIPDLVRTMEFSVAIDGEVPATVVAKLKELETTRQIALADKDRPVHAVLHFDAEHKNLGIYSPNALPSKNDPVPPTMLYPDLIPLPGSDPAAEANAVAECVLYVGRVHRLLALEHNPAELPMPKESKAKGLTPIVANWVVGPQGPSEAIPTRVPVGADVTLQVDNNSSKPLYVTVFGLDSKGALEILYPGKGDDFLPTVAGHPLQIPFTATISAAGARPDAVERTLIKIIATRDVVDFSPLLVKPTVGAKNLQTGSRSRGSENPLFELLKDSMHGGATRGLVPKLNSEWATLNLVLEVEPKK